MILLLKKVTSQKPRNFFQKISTSSYIWRSAKIYRWKFKNRTPQCLRTVKCRHPTHLRSGVFETDFRSYEGTHTKKKLFFLTIKSANAHPLEGVGIKNYKYAAECECRRRIRRHSHSADALDIRIPTCVTELFSQNFGLFETI